MSYISIAHRCYYILEDLDTEGNFLAVAAHEDGTLLFDISNPENPQFLFSLEGNNVWTVHLDNDGLNDYLYVGDQNSLNISLKTIKRPSQDNAKHTNHGHKTMENTVTGQ